LLLRYYSGNPFIAPGTIGSKSQHKTIYGLLDESYVFDDDTVMPRSDNSDQLSNNSQATQDSQFQSISFTNKDLVTPPESTIIPE
jgi:hypothetical protein